MGTRPPRRVLPVGAALLVALSAACARQGAPPGGPEDGRPPVVVATYPDTFAVLEDFRGPVRFRFDERISERVDGLLNDIVVVSPATGDVRVSHGRQEITVEMDGGFRPGLVYRVTLAPAVSDLFNNRMRTPFELVFSTGGEFTPNALAGLAWDRITGEPVADARAELVPSDADPTVVHVAVADTGGIYALRYVPPGRYTLQVYVDRDRDRTFDAAEPAGSFPLAMGASDTMLVNVPLLAPDTTPARVTSAETLDSTLLVVTFDDYLDPAVSVSALAVGLQRAEGASDTVVAPGVERVRHVWEYNMRVAEITDSMARLDSLEAAARAEALAEAAALRAARDSAARAAGDSVAAPTRDADVGGPPPPAPGARRSAPTPIPPAAGGGRAANRSPAQAVRIPNPGAPPRRDDPRPERRIAVVLDGPLPVNEPFTLVVTGVRNINGVTQGGGQAVVIRRPPADSVAADSTAVPADTAAAVRDSLDGVADSAVAATDTAAAVRDSAASVAGDSAAVATDSAATVRDSVAGGLEWAVHPTRRPVPRFQ